MLLRVSMTMTLNQRSKALIPITRQFNNMTVILASKELTIKQKRKASSFRIYLWLLAT